MLRQAMSAPPDPEPTGASQDPAIANRALALLAILLLALIALIAVQLEPAARALWQLMNRQQVDDVLPYRPAQRLPDEPADLPPPASGPKLVVADAAELLTPNDYPADALRKGQTGAVGFQLRIDPTGMPRRCLVTVSSKVASLDGATCRTALARFRFAPARDAAGRAIWSGFSRRVVWVLPADDAR